MKKLLFFLMTAVVLLTTSCQSEEDLIAPPTPPLPSVPVDTSLISSFPEGAEIENLVLQLPQEDHTRAEYSNFYQTKWNFWSEDRVHIRYAIYDENDNLFYCTGFANRDIELTWDSNHRFLFCIPKPDTEKYRLFIWIDKIGEDPTGYNIDWENKTISISDLQGKTQNDFSRLGDAMYYWSKEPETLREGSLIYLRNRVLKAIQIQTSKSFEPQFEELYRDQYITSSIKFFSNNDHTTPKFPKVWHWDDDTFDFETIKDNNYTFSCKPTDAIVIKDNSDEGEVVTHHVLAYAYTFGSNSNEMIDNLTGEVYKSFDIQVTSDDGTLNKSATISTILNYGGLYSSVRRNTVNVINISHNNP